MLKALGAIAFGLLAMCGVGYLIIKKQEDQAMKNQVDQAISNFGTNMKRMGTRVSDFFTAKTATEPASAQEVA